jgi:Spy/CpxP family protein refolding chaperone
MKPYQKSLAAVGSALLLVVVAAAALNAQNARMWRRNPGRANQYGMMFRPRAFLAGLNLTQQQKDQVKTIFANHKPDIQNVSKERAAAQKTLGDDIFNGADQATLQADAGKVSSAEWDAVLLRSKIWAEIKPVLTSDQLTQLQQRRQKIDQRVQNFLNRLGNETSTR